MSSRRRGSSTSTANPSLSRRSTSATRLPLPHVSTRSGRSARIRSKSSPAASPTSARACASGGKSLPRTFPTSRLPAPTAKTSSVRCGASAMTRCAGESRCSTTPRSSITSTAAVTVTAKNWESRLTKKTRRRTGGLRRRSALHVMEQVGAGLAQALRQQGYKLDQDLGAEARLLEDDLHHAVARQHCKCSGLQPHAGGKARFAVDHRHLAERCAGPDRRHRLEMAVRIGLHDFHPSLNDEQHVIVDVAFADDHLPCFSTVDLHETGQLLDVLAGEVRKEFRVADHVENLLRERGPLSQVFEGVQKHVLRLLEFGISNVHWKSGRGLSLRHCRSCPPERIRPIMRERPQAVKPDPCGRGSGS